MNLIEKYLGEERNKQKDFDTWLKKLEKNYTRIYRKVLKKIYADKDQYFSYNSFSDILDMVAYNVNVEFEKNEKEYKSQLEASVEGFIEDAANYF